MSQLTHPAQHRLVQKQREYANFLQMLAQNKQLVNYFEHFGDRFDTLDGGSEGSSPFLHVNARRADFAGDASQNPPAVADVVEHWQNVFRATNIAISMFILLRLHSFPQG